MACNTCVGNYSLGNLRRKVLEVVAYGQLPGCCMGTVHTLQLQLATTTIYNDCRRKELVTQYLSIRTDD